MLRRDLTAHVQAAVDRLVAEGRLPSGLPPVELQDTKDPAHGDFATNFAMVAAKGAGMNPRALADLVAGALSPSSLGAEGLASHASTLSPQPPLAAVEVAGPGFINLRLNPVFVAAYVPGVAAASTKELAGGRAASPSPQGGERGLGGEGITCRPKRINVEFVSVNPNGPITIGSGRGAAYGSTLANVLEAAGNVVHREYYINDGVNSEQMRLFAESVRAIALGREVPENGYKGDYVADVADVIGVTTAYHLNSSIAEEKDLIARLRSSGQDARAPIHEVRILKWERIAEALHGETLKQSLPRVSAPDLQFLCEVLMTISQRYDLAAFGVTFDTWFSEQSLHDSGVVESEIAELVAKGAADDRPIRHKLKLAKGGRVEDVEIEEQAAEEDPESPSPQEGEKGWDEGRPALDSVSPSPPDPLSPARGEGEKRTLWLRSTKFGDDMDRVLRRKDGRLTYIASDIAYHKDKLERTKNLSGPPLTPQPPLPSGSGEGESGFTPPPSPLPATQGIRGEGELDAKLITILGPDHHGYIGRLHAVMAAVELAVGSTQSSVSPPSEPLTANRQPLTEVEAKLYASPEERDACQASLEKARKELDVVIFQLVRFMKDGKPAPMRKRDGNIYALIDLIDEIGKKVKPEASQEEQRKSGKDVARFFYLMRSHDTTFDFDLDLAEKQSDENPVFYVQYAHARICSLLRKAEEVGGLRVTESSSGLPTADCQLLTHHKETALIKKILDLPYEVSRCAEDYGVHRLTTYAIELARSYHHFYDACRVIQPDQPELTRARLLLCEATRVALRAVFELLGIEAPESM